MAFFGPAFVAGLFLCLGGIYLSRKAPLLAQELPMFRVLKYAFSSLAWYAKQDAEAWKMLSFLVGVLSISVAIASVTH
jgi:hypothetical protein